MTRARRSVRSPEGSRTSTGEVPRCAVLCAVCVCAVRVRVCWWPSAWCAFGGHSVL
jgi:hypothetical protein